MKLRTVHDFYECDGKDCEEEYDAGEHFIGDEQSTDVYDQLEEDGWLIVERIPKNNRPSSVYEDELYCSKCREQIDHIIGTIVRSHKQLADNVTEE